MKVHKKNQSWTGGMATMLLCTLLFSCNNEDFLENGNPEKACDNICFGILPDKNAQTKGYAGNKEEIYTINRFVLRSGDPADTLCVRASVSDGINVTGFEGEQAITRGTPMTKDNFYDKFHVLAYWSKKETLVDSRFYMDEDVTQKGSIWSTDQIYYWPGAEHSLQFYAWAPTDADGLYSPSSPRERCLAYTVPETAIDQKDIAVATTEEIPGDKNMAVPLTFKHICTAVRFAVGSQIQPGQIKNVALKGVRNAGIYDMADGTWTLDETTADFSQDLNKKTIGNEANGDEITTVEGTFMMLPQTLPDDATVEVVFTNVSGVDRILTASIGNTEWTMGTTVTYKLSITPEYELEFVSQPETQDAHYIIYPIVIRADNLPEGGWTLTSNDRQNVTFVEKFPDEGIKNLVDQGYWLKGYCGEGTLTSSSTGKDTIYVFLTENISEIDREITLSLAPVNVQNAKPATFTFTQYCPAWNNDIGVERIQDDDYPWGFNWTSDMKIVYTMPSGVWAGIIHLLFGIFGDHSYVESSGWAIAGTWKVTVDFSKVPPLTVATSPTDGLKNTWDIYNFDGISEATTIMDQLVSWGGRPDKELPVNPGEFAAWACAKKNRFGIKTKITSGNTVYVPDLKQVDMVWYLPAKDETPKMKDELSGDYWTSTAITNPGTTAYKYTAGGETSDENRNRMIHVRAVRTRLK